MTFGEEEVLFAHLLAEWYACIGIFARQRYTHAEDQAAISCLTGMKLPRLLLFNLDGGPSPTIEDALLALHILRTYENPRLHDPCVNRSRLSRCCWEVAQKGRNYKPRPGKWPHFVYAQQSGYQDFSVCTQTLCLRTIDLQILHAWSFGPNAYRSAVEVS